MAKKTSQKTAKAKADLLFSKLIRELGYCQRCGRRPPEIKLETSHIFKRDFSGVRCDPDNAFCLCSACHRWWHAHPTETYAFTVSIMGEEAYEKLLAKKIALIGEKIDWLAELEHLQHLTGVGLS